MFTPTEEQLRVVWTGDGPKIVLAGAGCAKTSTLLLRIRRLVEGSRAPDGRVLSWGIPAERILLTTFSKRGAGDMERRARKLGVPHGVQYRTLNSVGFEMVRSNSIDRRPIVPARWQLRRLVREQLDRIEKELGPGSRSKLPKIKEVLHEIALAKAALIWPDAPWIAAHGTIFPSYQEWAVSRERHPLDEGLAEVIGRVYVAHEACSRAPELYGIEGDREPPFKRDAGTYWITFDDQLALPARAILRRGPRDSWAHPWYGAFWHVLCDEVQDNNLAQWVVLEWVAHERNLVCVGDDQQAIFEWRGALPALMREFVGRHRDAEILTLSFNFRSGQTILDTANKILANCPDRLVEFKLRCGASATEANVLVRTPGTPTEEAKDIIAQIEAAVRDGHSPDEISVLYRINAQSGPLELECIRRGIPYRIAGSSFFSRGEIRAAIGYLACALDERDQDGLADCCNAPTRYLGREFLEKNPTLATAREHMGANALGQWRRRVEELFRVVAQVKVRLERKSVAEAIRYVFETVGVRKFFREEGTEEDDDTEVDEACAALVHCASATETARGLIDYARSMTRTGHEDSDGERDHTPRITLSTVHKAKGLEWDTTFVTGLVAGLFPLAKAPVDEERRLFYVAMTRARKLVVASYPTLGSEGKVQTASRFLLEAELLSREDAAKARSRALAADSDPGEDPVEEVAASAVRELTVPELDTFLEARRRALEEEGTTF